MAAVTTDGEEKICFRFNQGLCKNKNCKYVHKIMSEQQKKDTGYDKDRKDFNKKTKLNNENKLKNSMKNNNSSGTNGMHNPSSVTAIPLTREHYMVIGNPRGKISDTNPNGLSKQQMHTMKSILIYESNKYNIDSNNNDNSNINYISNNKNNNNMQGYFESWENRNNNNFSQLNTNIASFTMATFDSPDNSSILDNSNPQTLNVKQSLQVLRRINRLKASAMKKKTTIKYSKFSRSC